MGPRPLATAQVRFEAALSESNASLLDCERETKTHGEVKRGSSTIPRNKGVLKKLSEGKKVARHDLVFLKVRPKVEFTGDHQDNGESEEFLANTLLEAEKSSRIDRIAGGLEILKLAPFCSTSDRLPPPRRAFFLLAVAEFGRGWNCGVPRSGRRSCPRLPPLDIYISLSRINRFRENQG